MAVGLQNMLGAIGRLFARTSVQRGTLVSAVFITVIAAGGYATSDRLGLLHWLRQVSGSGTSNAGLSNSPTGAASLSDDDPVKNFTKTGVGQVLFTATSSDNCRRTLFDNRTGASYDAGEMLCGGPAPEPQSERLQSLSKPFRRER
jgi:hypothetical protein